MRPYGSLKVLINFMRFTSPYVSLWVFIGPSLSPWVFIGLSASL